MKIWRVDNDVELCMGFKLKNSDMTDNLRKLLNNKYLINENYEYELSPIHDIENFDIENLNNGVNLWSDTRQVMLTKDDTTKIMNKYSDYVEVIPLYYKEKNLVFYILKVLNIIDALDYNKSEFRIVHEIYRVGVEKIVFNNSINNFPIFRTYLDNMPLAYIYVNEEFKNFIESNNIKGLKFDEVYDSELLNEN